MNKYKYLRITKGYTQEECANILGVSQTFISQLERGSRSASYKLIEKIAMLYDVKITDITIKPKPIVLLIRKIKKLDQSDYALVGDIIDRLTLRK